MYYRRAQPTTRGLENGYEESDEDTEESSGEEGCEEDRSEKGAGEKGSGEEARQEGSEEEVTSLQALRPATLLRTHRGSYRRRPSIERPLSKISRAPTIETPADKIQLTQSV